ncbi:hypothetical protein STRTUCAR8_09232, partial [Streptomyces turgidiscabies Car8]
YTRLDVNAPRITKPLSAALLRSRRLTQSLALPYLRRQAAAVSAEGAPVGEGRRTQMGYLWAPEAVEATTRRVAGPLHGTPVVAGSRWSAGSGQAADMGEGLLEEHPLTARHLVLDHGGGRLLRTEPDQIEGVLARAAVAGHRDDVGEGHRVLTRVVERGDAQCREILRDGEGLRGGRDSGQCHWAEILLQIAHEGIAYTLVVQNTARHQSAADVAVRSDAQEQPDAGDFPVVIDTHGYGFYVQDRHPGARLLEFVGCQPAGRGFDHLRHWLIVLSSRPVSAEPLHVERATSG